MKPNIIIATALRALLFSCKNNLKKDQTKADTSTTLSYPFTPKYKINWQPGDKKNAVIVLDCLKHYVANDMRGATKNFADTAEFISDRFYLKV